jgi:hypothetical protein
MNIFNYNFGRYLNDEIHIFLPKSAKSLAKTFSPGQNKKMHNCFKKFGHSVECAKKHFFILSQNNLKIKG